MQIANHLPNLPEAITRDVFSNLCGSLPAPINNTPDGIADRDEGAVAALAALQPENAFEAQIAMHIVGNNAHGLANLRRAEQPDRSPAEARRDRAQGIALLRLAQSGLRQFTRDRAARDKAFAARHPAAMERAGYYFSDCSVPLPAPPPAPAEATQPAPQPPAPQQPAATPAEPALETDWTDPVFATLTDAELYAVTFPDRAVLIRSHGGMPKRVDFDAPHRAIVDGLVTGKTPVLRSLDQPHRQIAAQ
jgi:hypothetical protein